MSYTATGVDLVANTPSSLPARTLHCHHPGRGGGRHSFVISVTAVDQFGSQATEYSGTVHFASSDVQAQLPANATLTYGVGTFDALFLNAGSQALHPD